MGFSLGDIGKKLNEYGGDIGSFFGGAANGVEHLLGMAPASTPAPSPLPAPTAPAPINYAPGPSSNPFTAGNSYMPLAPAPVANPAIQPAPPKSAPVKLNPTRLSPPQLPGVLSYLQPNLNQAASTITAPLRPIGAIAGAASNLVGKGVAQVNKLDNNFSLPVIGNVADMAGGFIQSPLDTLKHGGQAASGINPYAGQTLPEMAGSGLTDALNVATLGAGGVLAHLGEDVAGQVADRLGGNVLAKTAGKVIGTTAAAVPVTAAYGGTQALANGATTPGQVAQGVGEGALLAPVLGAAHGAGYLGKVGLKTFADNATSPETRAAVKGQGGYIGGAKATAFDQAKAAGVVSPGVDGHPKFEADDSQAKFNLSPHNTTLGQTLEHPTLYQDYPQLANIRVNYDSTLGPKELGGFEPATNTMTLNPKINRAQLENTILHETQHAIQTIEGHAPGGSPFDAHIKGMADATGASPMDVYRSLAGEAEARNVAGRQNLTPDQRDAQPFNSTFDTPVSRQVVLKGDRAAASVEKGKPKVGIKTPGTPEKPSVAQSRMTPNGKFTPAPKDIPTPKDWADGDIPVIEKPRVSQKSKTGEPKISEDQRQATGKSNPVKVSIPEVAKGDHAKAISNSQLTGELVDKPAGFAMRSARKLSAADDKLMPRAIEHPELVKTAENPGVLQKAITDFRAADNAMHAVNQELKGEPTAYRTNHALHDWELPADIAESKNFKAVNEQARLHPTIEHGEAVGLKLKDRPYAEAMQEYFQRGSAILRKQALEKGMKEADAGAKMTRSFDMGGGRSLPVSDAGKKALQGMERPKESGKITKGYDASIKSLKQTLLSLSQFHPINISRKAGMAMTLTGHPLRARQGVVDAFRSINKDYSDRLQRSAQADGTFDAAARIGTPIGVGNDFTVSGGFNPAHHGIGERTIFEQQMPALHVQLVKSVVEDLEKNNIDLDSPEARAAGTRVNEIMGYVNKEVRGLDARNQRILSRIALAPQFTRSKWATLKGVATDRGLARKYAIAAVLGDTLAVFVAQTALGALFGQKQDNLRDTLIRAIVHPSIATPFKDPKGNNIEIGLPSTYISEAFGLLGNLTRGKDGRLGISVDPSKIPENLADYGRARLNVPLAAALKIATNSDYANKPLYDPQAGAGKKVTQGATTLVAGELPIGLQALAHSNIVTNHLPTDMKEVLQAGKSGLNPFVAAAASATGLNARTDKTTGKGLETTQYFDARGAARASLNKNDQAVFDAIHPDTKNPVTGQYQVKPTVWDSQTRASDYLSHPAVLAADNKLNQQLADNGTKIDPFFQLPTDQQQKFLTYSTLNQQDPVKARMEADNPWMSQLQSARSDFFGSLPPGDPNKPQAPVTYPAASAPVAALQDKYFKLTDPAQKSQFIKDNPDLVAQFAAEDKYNRTVRGIKNLPQYDQYPTADPQTQKILDFYNSLPKSKSAGNTGADNKSRSNWIRNNPGAYSQMTNYLTKTSLYNLEQSAQQAAFQGQGFDQKGLKAISSLAKDIGTTTDANGNNIYTMGTPGNTGNTGYSKSSYSSKAGFTSGRGVDVGAGGKYHKAKVSLKQRGSHKAVSGKAVRAKPKVAIRKSLV